MSTYAETEHVPIKIDTIRSSVPTTRLTNLDAPHRTFNRTHRPGSVLPSRRTRHRNGCKRGATAATSHDSGSEMNRIEGAQKGPPSWRF